MSVELSAAIGGAEWFAAAFNTGFMTVAIVCGHALNTKPVVAIGLRRIKTSAVIFTATTIGGTDAGTARGAQSK